MRYLIDTDVISYLSDQESPYHKNVISHLSSLLDNDTESVSILTIYEKQYGITHAKTQDTRDRLQKEFDIFFDEDVERLHLSEEGAKIFAVIKDCYQKYTGITDKANKKNTVDFIIAATAIDSGAVLAYNDSIYEAIVQASSEIYDLKIEKWTQ